MNYLTPEQVLFLHARLIDETGGSHGVRDLGLLLSDLARLQAVFEGKDIYPNLFSKAAALMHSLVKNHPFLDGNKRTGIAAAGIFLQLNGYLLATNAGEFQRFTLAVAQGQTTLEDMAGWFRHQSKPLAM